MMGENAIVNEIMRGQKFETGMYHSILARNRYFYLRILPRLSLMITCNSKGIPLSLPKKLFKECNYIDEGVLNDHKVEPKMINYVGLKVDYAKNLQVLHEKFYLTEDLCPFPQPTHPIQIIHEEFSNGPKTAMRRDICSLLKKGIFDTFGEQSARGEGMFVNEFLILWPLYEATIKKKRNYAQMNINERFVGNARDTFEKLKLSFHLNDAGYPTT